MLAVSSRNVARFVGQLQPLWVESWSPCAEALWLQAGTLGASLAEGLVPSALRCGESLQGREMLSVALPPYRDGDTVCGHGVTFPVGSYALIQFWPQSHAGLVE